MSWKESILEIFEASDTMDFEELYIENLRWSTKRNKHPHLNGYKLHNGHAVKCRNNETTNYPLMTQKQARMLMDELQKKKFSVEVLSGKVSEDVYSFWQWMHRKGRPWVGVKLMKKANAVVDSVFDGVCEVPAVEGFKQIHFVDKKPQVLKVKKHLKNVKIRNYTELKNNKSAKKTNGINIEKDNKHYYKQPMNGFPISNLSCSPKKNTKKILSQENNILLTTIVSSPTSFTLDNSYEECTKLENNVKQKSKTLNNKPTTNFNIHHNIHKNNGYINGVITNEKNDPIKVNSKDLKIKPIQINSDIYDEAVKVVNECTRPCDIIKDVAQKQCGTQKITFYRSNKNNSNDKTKISDNNNSKNIENNIEKIDEKYKTNNKTNSTNYEDNKPNLNNYNSKYKNCKNNINDNYGDESNNSIPLELLKQNHIDNKIPTTPISNKECAQTNEFADNITSNSNTKITDKNGIVKMNNKALKPDTQNEGVKLSFNGIHNRSLNRRSKIDHLIRQYNDRDASNFNRNSMIYSSLRTDSPFKRFSRGNVSERYMTPLKTGTLNNTTEEKTCKSPIKTPPTHLSNSSNEVKLDDNSKHPNVTTLTTSVPTNGVESLFKHMHNRDSQVNHSTTTPSIHPSTSSPTHVECNVSNDRVIIENETPVESNHHEIKHFFNESYICISKRTCRSSRNNTQENSPKNTYKTPFISPRYQTNDKNNTPNKNLFSTPLVQKTPSMIDANYKYQPKASPSNSVKLMIKKFNDISLSNEATRNLLKPKPLY